MFAAPNPHLNFYSLDPVAPTDLLSKKYSNLFCTLKNTDDTTDHKNTDACKKFHTFQ